MLWHLFSCDYTEESSRLNFILHCAIVIISQKAARRFISEMLRAVLK